MTEKNLKKVQFNQNGITLIALVITIIIVCKNFMKLS